MRVTDQISFADIDLNYKAFVDKFKPKKTTDDCYTPDSIFAIIVDYVRERYGVTEDRIVRPFWPGMNYREFDYPDGCVVVDNPPFSILSQIVNDYNRAGVAFFMFEPYLTAFSRRGCTHVITATPITYENGAEVQTSFCTSLEPGILARSDPELMRRIKDENARLIAKTKRQLLKYIYPDSVVTSADIGYLSMHDVPFTIYDKDAHFINALDSQRAQGKTIFGQGYLLSTKAAAEKAAAEKAAAVRWALSEREQAIIAKLDKGEAT
jgi:hypothetical protein